VVTHHTRQETLVTAEAEDIYVLAADATRWPHMFRRVVHVDVLHDDGAEQLLRVWHIARGDVRDCTVRRRLDPGARSISYEQVVTRPPVAAMSAHWSVQSAGPRTSRLVLTHRYDVVGDDADGASWIDLALARCAAADLASIKRHAEAIAATAGTYLSFCDAEVIHGSASSVFDFVSNVDAWTEKLPHVGRLKLTERTAGVQHIEASVFAPDGSVHATTAVRLCFPERGSIFYKQLRTSAPIAAHTGRWEFAESDGTVIARSWHTVTLDVEGLRAELGPELTTVQLRAKVRHALGTDSLMTLRRAKDYIEGSRSV
jgi:aromatase